jgi:hypothetical protein
LWDRIREGIPQTYPMDEHLATMAEIYRRMLAERRHSLVEV